MNCPKQLLQDKKALDTWMNPKYYVMRPVIRKKKALPFQEWSLQVNEKTVLSVVFVVTVDFALVTFLFEDFVSQ